jgi:hypothetical protein
MYYRIKIRIFKSKGEKDDEKKIEETFNAAERLLDIYLRLEKSNQ